MSDKYNVNGFNRDQNYELQIRNRGKHTGLTFEFQEDLQKYIDEGIFVDELNDGFTNKEKRDLAEKFREIHEAKGYNTDFGKMKKDAKFTYTADEYIQLAKAAGYVLKDMTPKEEAMLRKQLEASAAEFAQTVDDAEISPAVVEEPAAETGEKIVLTQIDPVPISINPEITPDLSQNIDIKPIETKPEEEDDPFKLSENDPLFAEIEVERVNVDELPEAEIDTTPSERKTLPKSFLKRHGIKPDEFENMSFRDKARLYQEFTTSTKYFERQVQKENRRPLLSRIFGRKKPEST